MSEPDSWGGRNRRGLADHELVLEVLPFGRRQWMPLVFARAIRTPTNEIVSYATREEAIAAAEEHAIATLRRALEEMQC